MTITDKIRHLAKSPYYQVLYNQAERFDFPLFINNRDLTYLQLLFLNFLQFYKVLFEEMASKDMSSKITSDFIYEDAYMVYRRESALEKKDSDAPNKSNKPQKSLKPGAVRSDWTVKMRKGKIKK